MLRGQRDERWWLSARIKGVAGMCVDIGDGTWVLTFPRIAGLLSCLDLTVGSNFQ